MIERPIPNVNVCDQIEEVLVQEADIREEFVMNNSVDEMLHEILNDTENQAVIEIPPALMQTNRIDSPNEFDRNAAGPSTTESSQIYDTSTGHTD